MTWVFLENFITMSSRVGLSITSSSFIVVLTLTPKSFPTSDAQSSIPRWVWSFGVSDGLISHFLLLSLYTRMKESARIFSMFLPVGLPLTFILVVARIWGAGMSSGTDDGGGDSGMA